MAPIDDLAAEVVSALRSERFAGVVVIADGDRIVLDRAAGLADRAEGRPITASTRFATASGTKGFTALAVVSLIEEELLAFDTSVVEVTGTDLPHIDPAVTVEHLLSHTSGIGDYLDEDELDDVDDYVLDVPVQTLLGPEDYVPILNRHPQTSPPGARFVYNNSGFIVLALLIERVAGRSYHEEVAARVFEPAGLADTAFCRSDRLPADTALGYLTDGRTNIHHLPVIGTGDGGAYTTAPDLLRFWDAFLGGRIVGRDLVERMTVVANREDGGRGYGLGFWLGADERTVELEGMDAGVSLRTGADPGGGLRYVVLANNPTDTWPVASIIDRHLAS
ncbi:MAG: serine hydrolase domain-containing protein [Actinomycetota bacterium]